MSVFDGGSVPPMCEFDSGSALSMDVFDAGRWEVSRQEACQGACLPLIR